MQYTGEQLINILLSCGYVTQEEINETTAYANAHRDDIIDVLIAKSLINQDIIGQAMAEYLKVPHIDLRSHEVDKETLLLIPENIARKNRIVLFKKTDKEVSVATDSPDDNAIGPALKTLFPGTTQKVYFALSASVNEMLNRYNLSLQERLDAIIKSSEHVAPEIVDSLIADAVGLGASDIHFEPYADRVGVRFRVDGVLRDIAQVPHPIYENILNRIKVLSGIRLDMHAQTQDGSMQFKRETIKVDIRTSIIPTIEGEKIVMRILSSYVKGLGLEDIGFSPEHQRIIIEAANKPFGMIIVTGPTGSGKSTTLYSLLKILNEESVNITTIEDPVEYKMRGLNQIQVNSFADLTFARGLRAIVRQDPDIILVGEIRDEETAEIAVNAALTGHLLFSTFHTNDAATTIPRLINMKIQPYLLASTLELVIAQRLIRKLCNKCKYSIEVSQDDIRKSRPGCEQFFPGKKYTLFAAKGCPHCGNSGYHGQTAIFEFIHNSPAMQELIARRPTTQEIWELARSEGSKSLFEDGIEKVKNGITTLEELLRIAEPPKDIGAKNRGRKNIKHD